MKQLEKEIPFTLTDYALLLNTTVSTEGYTDFLKNVPEFFNKRLATVSEFFVGKDVVMNDYSTRAQNVYVKELIKSRSTLNKTASTIDYGLVKRRLVPVPQGLSVDVLTLARVLEENNKLINDNIHLVLSDTAEVVARLVSDKDYRVSSRPVMMDKKQLKALKVVEDNFKEVLSPKKITDNAAIKDVLPSIPHLTEAIETAIKYSTSNTTDEYEKIKDSVKVITNYTNSLYETFKEEEVNIKKKRIIEVSEYLSTSANYVTQAINTMYLSNQSVILMNNLVKAINK